MKAKKNQLEVVFNLLKETDSVLSLKDARIRDSILKPLGEQLDIYYKDRENIYKKYCIKDEAGEPKLGGENKNQYEFKKEVVDEVNAELKLLHDEEIDVYITDDVGKFKEILDKSEYKPKIGETQTIDEVLK